MSSRFRRQVTCRKISVRGEIRADTPASARQANSTSLSSNTAVTGALYIGIILLAPVMEAAWHRFGMRSFWALAIAAIIVDVMHFAFDLRWLGFANYLFVWGAIFLLGYAWLDERFSVRMMIAWASLGFVALLLLVRFKAVPGLDDKRSR